MPWGDPLQPLTRRWTPIGYLLASTDYLGCHSIPRILLCVSDGIIVKAADIVSFSRNFILLLFFSLSIVSFSRDFFIFFFYWFVCVFLSFSLRLESFLSKGIFMIDHTIEYNHTLLLLLLLFYSVVSFVLLPTGDSNLTQARHRLKIEID